VPVEPGQAARVAADAPEPFGRLASAPAPLLEAGEPLLPGALGVQAGALGVQPGGQLGPGRVLGPWRRGLGPWRRAPGPWRRVLRPGRRVLGPWRRVLRPGRRVLGPRREPANVAMLGLCHLAGLLQHPVRCGRRRPELEQVPVEQRLILEPGVLLTGP